VTIEQLQEYSEVFEFFDIDKSNSIDPNEFCDVMRSLGEHLGDEKLRAIFASFDEDGNEILDFEEFVRLMKQYYKPLESIDDFLNLFVSMAERGGILTPERLKQVCLFCLRLIVPGRSFSVRSLCKRQ